MEKENTSRQSWSLRAAALLLLMVLGSAWVLSGLSARFSTGARGEDEARVATFRVSAAGELTEDLALDIIPGETKTVQVNIVSDSEVALDYIVTVELEEENITPLQFSVPDMASTQTAVVSNGQTLTFTAQAQPNSAKTYNLEITWPADQGEGTDPNLTYMGMIDYMTVTVVATQID